ncbi:stage II sporulation protein M [bacterium]|nr:stage II sporulation protein M [bacterium]
MSDILITPVEGAPIGWVFVQNSRILLAAFILSIFTFGVAALVMTPLTYAIFGYLFSQVLLAGYNPAFILAAVFTHGVVEIPIIVIAVAVSLRLGAVITRVPKGQTVGHAWIVAFGESLKLILAVVIPGLLLAAAVETIITPRVVVWVLGARRVSAARLYWNRGEQPPLVDCY